MSMNNDSQSANKTPKLLQDGPVRGKPTEGALTRNPDGKLQYAAVFVILEGKDKGSHITWWGNLDPVGMAFTRESLVLLGWNGKQRLSDFVPTAEVILVIEHFTKTKGAHAGQTVARVKYINGVDGKGRKGPTLAETKLSAEDAAAAADSVMDQLMALGGEADGAAVPEPKSAVNEDDLPF